MNANHREVYGPDGQYGLVDTTCWPSMDEKAELEVDVSMTDGSHISIPADVLIEQKDGRYYLPLHRRDLAALPHHDKPMPGTDGCWPCRDEGAALDEDAGVEAGASGGQH